MMVAMTLIDSARGGHEGDQYVPPRVVDGRIVPGHFIAAGENRDEGDGEDTPQ